jgi:NitT/TauT family transport system permease protein
VTNDMSRQSNAAILAEDTVKIPSRDHSHPHRRPPGVASALRLRIWLPSVIAVAVVLSIWEGLSALDPSFWPQIILSKPTDIGPALWDAVTDSLTWQEFWITFKETAIGFAIASLVGFLLGAAIGMSAIFRSATYPMLIFFQSMPRVALIPVFIAWFGFGVESKIALAVTLAFFPVMINTITGLAMIDNNALLLMRSMRASKFQQFWMLRLPASMPTVMAGLKTGLTFALIGAIVAELSAANEGVGHLIETASFQLRMDDVFAYLFLLALMGLGLFAVMGGVEKKFLSWHNNSRD